MTLYLNALGWTGFWGIGIFLVVSFAALLIYESPGYCEKDCKRAPAFAWYALILAFAFWILSIMLVVYTNVVMPPAVTP